MRNIFNKIKALYNKFFKKNRREFYDGCSIDLDTGVMYETVEPNGLYYDKDGVLLTNDTNSNIEVEIFESRTQKRVIERRNSSKRILEDMAKAMETPLDTGLYYEKDDEIWYKTPSGKEVFSGFIDEEKDAAYKEFRVKNLRINERFEDRKKRFNDSYSVVSNGKVTTWLDNNRNVIKQVTHK